MHTLIAKTQGSQEQRPDAYMSGPVIKISLREWDKKYGEMFPKADPSLTSPTSLSSLKAWDGQETALQGALGIRN